MRYSRRTVAAWSAGSAVAGATVGGSIAWFVDNGRTAPWFGAIGTWVGSIGTIATIGWAVITFQHQQGQKRQEDIDAAVARREEELVLARYVTFTYGGSVQSKGTVTKGFIEFSNGLQTPVRIVGVRVVNSTVPSVSRHGLVVDSGSKVRDYFDIDPPLILSPGQRAASVSAVEVEITYEIDGVRWSRTGTSDPVRL